MAGEGADVGIYIKGVVLIDVGVRDPKGMPGLASARLGQAWPGQAKLAGWLPGWKAGLLATPSKAQPGIH